LLRLGGMAGEASQDPRVIELTPRPSVAVRVQKPFEDLDLGGLFDLHLPNVADRLADLGGTPAGPPYGRYHEYGPQQADVEIGIPVIEPVANLRPLAECEPGEIGNSELPGGRAAVTVHAGGYDSLAATYDRLRDWIAAEGLEDAPGPWESYITDPSEVSDSSQLRTEVVWPLG
jgi:effector-binding domain-containing protein